MKSTGKNIDMLPSKDVTKH